MTTARRTLNNIHYQLFVVAISLLAVVNAGLILLLQGKSSTGVMTLVDALLTPFFLVDFALRMTAARSKWRYFFLQFGWADLLGSLWLPGLDGLRLFRIYRIVTIVRDVPGASGGRPLRTLRRERANSVLGSMILLAILVLEIGGIAVLYYEGANANANITTPGDALWWGIVTIATVGYGDKYPITAGGRIVGAAEITTGVVVFSTISGFLATAFMNRGKTAEQREAEEVANPQVLLAEIQRAAAEQAQREAALDARLAAIEALLTRQGSDGSGQPVPIKPAS